MMNSKTKIERLLVEIVFSLSDHAIQERIDIPVDESLNTISIPDNIPVTVAGFHFLVGHILRHIWENTSYISNHLEEDWSIERGIEILEQPRDFPVQQILLEFLTNWNNGQVDCIDMVVFKIKNFMKLRYISYIYHTKLHILPWKHRLLIGKYILENREYYNTLSECPEDYILSLNLLIDGQVEDFNTRFRAIENAMGYFGNRSYIDGQLDNLLF